jgi:hypothetical protein
VHNQTIIRIRQKVLVTAPYRFLLCWLAEPRRPYFAPGKMPLTAEGGPEAADGARKPVEAGWAEQNRVKIENERGD